MIAWKRSSSQRLGASDPITAFSFYHKEDRIDRIIVPSMIALAALLPLLLLISSAAFQFPCSRWISKTSKVTHFSQYDDGVEFAAGLIGSDVEALEFDPLKFSSNKSEKELKWYREAEITHGRVAMLAVFGWITPDTKTNLGYIENNPFIKAFFGLDVADFAGSEMRNPIVAARVVGPQFFVELFLLIGLVEAIRFQRILKDDSEVEPGNLNLDPFGLTNPISEEMIKDFDWKGSVPRFKGKRFGPNALPSRVFGLLPTGIRKLKLSELKHGRLAMISIVGLVMQTLITGESFMQQMQGYGFNAFR